MAQFLEEERSRLAGAATSPQHETMGDARPANQCAHWVHLLVGLLLNPLTSSL